MSRTPVVAAVDQGTSSTKAIAIGPDGHVVARASAPVAVEHPRPGWVEQDPLAIRDSVVACLKKLGRNPAIEIVAIGIDNQRESAIAWDRATGDPVSPLLGWQDRRTAARAVELAGEPAAMVRRITGLPLDPMFSALKFEWILNSIDPGRLKARAGKIVLGTVDAWLVRCLTGEERVEAGNAARTQVLDVDAVAWSPQVMDLLSIPAACLPPIVDSDAVSGPITVDGLTHLPPIHAIMGDSHAALFAHGARTPGAVKATYGTGSSVMGLAGETPSDDGGMVRTIGWSCHGRVARAFEGNILSTGATLAWLGEIVGRTPGELDELAWTVESAGGVALVPAFDGLGAPWWDPAAKAVMTGMNLGTSVAHLARAAMDSIVFQIEDALTAADQEVGSRITSVYADGGPTRNDRLMQLQANVSRRTIVRSGIAELSASGVAQMAGFAVGLFDETAPPQAFGAHDSFIPQSDGLTADVQAWHDALARSRFADKNKGV